MCDLINTLLLTSTAWSNDVETTLMTTFQRDVGALCTQRRENYVETTLMATFQREVGALCTQHRTNYVETTSMTTF